MRNSCHRRKIDLDETVAKTFGEHVSIDFVAAKTQYFEEVSGRTDALLFYDKATGWMQLYPTFSKSAQEVERVLRHVTGQHLRIKYLYSDSAPEFTKACRSLGIDHDTSTPGDPQNNGLIERRVQIAKRGGRALLMQASLPDCFALYAIQAYLFARNARHKHKDGDGLTAWERRHERNHRGSLYEFGSLVHFRPPPTSDLGKHSNSFGPTTVPGIFLGYEYRVAGIWSGKYLVCPLEAFERFSFRAASMTQGHRIHRHISRVTKLVEMVPVYFPFADAYFSHNFTLHGRLDAFLDETDDTIPDPTEGLEPVHEPDDAAEHDGPTAEQEGQDLSDVDQADGAREAPPGEVDLCGTRSREEPDRSDPDDRIDHPVTSDSDAADPTERDGQHTDVSDTTGMTIPAGNRSASKGQDTDKTGKARRRQASPQKRYLTLARGTHHDRLTSHPMNGNRWEYANGSRT